jgi:hypothetical protein
VVDFFNDVEEDLRADRWRSFGRKALPWIIVLVVAVVLGVAGLWGWDAWTKSNTAKASEAYDRGLKALSTGDKAAAETAFVEVTKSGSRAYKSLALMQRAGLQVVDNKPDAAIKLFDESAKAAPSPIIADAAGLKAAFLLMDKGSLAEVEKRLQPLIEEGRPYRPFAREALALNKLLQGKPKDAKGDFVVLTLSPDIPEDVRARAQAAIQMIDSGTTGQLAAIVKEAAKLPPEAASQGNPFASMAGQGPQSGAAAQ